MTAGPAQGRSFSAIDPNRKRACPPQDAGTIQHLHSTPRALPRPLLESLTRAFRKRFQVPDTAVTIADRISQKCHHVWTRAFLVSYREVRSLKPYREVRSLKPHREVRSVKPHREVRSAEQHREVRSAERHQGTNN